VKALPWILVAACAAALLSYPLSDHDLWWHLASGREMLRSHQWLRVDPFCTSSARTPWIDLHWGFQIAVFGLHSLAGLSGLVVARVGLVFALVAVSLGRRLSWETALCAILGIALCRTFLDLRPLLATLVHLAILWRILEMPLSKTTTVVALAVQLALVNTQGLFLLGPLFALAATVGRVWDGERTQARHLALLAGAMLVASLANPWGAGAFQLASVVAGRIGATGSSVFAREIPENMGWISWILDSPVRALLPLWLGVLTFLWWRTGTGSRGRLVLLAGCLVLSFLAVRNLPILLLAMLVSVEAPNLSWRWIRWAVPVVGSGLCAFGLLDLRWNLPGSWIAPTHLPSDETLRRMDPSRGPVFHELRAGGWMSWRTPSRRTCWADTRLVLHDEVFVRRYLDALDHPEDFDRWSDGEGFAWTLVPVSAWPRWKPLAAHILGSPRWRLVHADGAWALFSRTNPDASPPPFPTDSVELEIHRRFGANPRLEKVVHAQWTSLVSLGGSR